MYGRNLSNLIDYFSDFDPNLSEETPFDTTPGLKMDRLNNVRWPVAVFWLSDHLEQQSHAVSLQFKNVNPVPVISLNRFTFLVLHHAPLAPTGCTLPIVQ